MKRNQPREIISFRLFSPFSMHDEISNLLMIKGSELDEVGPPAKVRQKKIQTGIGPSSESWSITLVRESEVDITKGIETVLNWLNLRKLQLRALIDKGYENDIYVSVWPDKKLGVSISAKLLKKLAEAHITLHIDSTCGFE